MGWTTRELQRWRMRLTDECQAILGEVEALKTESLTDRSNAEQSQRSLASIPDDKDRPGAVEELLTRVREAVPVPDLGPVALLELQAFGDAELVIIEAERILHEFDACQHLFTCRCQRQRQLFSERIKPFLNEFDQFSAPAEALRKLWAR